LSEEAYCHATVNCCLQVLIGFTNPAVVFRYFGSEGD